MKFNSIEDEPIHHPEIRPSRKSADEKPMKVDVKAKKVWFHP